MARKLKVFQAQFGFFDSVVAASSQAAALRAWGAHQNLFLDGYARLCADQDAIAAALAQPEMPLRRALGSNDPFTLTPRAPDGPQTPPTPKQRDQKKPSGRKAAAEPAPKRVAPPPQPPPDRSRLDRAEAALQTLVAARHEEEQRFEARRAALDAEETAAATRFDAANAHALAEVKRETQAFEAAAAAGRKQRPR